MTTTKRLYVLRHAKSSWDDPSAPDHDRPLSERGRRAVGVLAAYIASEQIEPELVLCSSARRTRDTLEGLGLTGQVMIEHRLYAATCDDLIDRLHRVSAYIGSVMLVGHNPALQMLVMRLAAAERPGRPESAEGLEAVRNKLPTGALVTLETQVAWSELRPNCAELVDYVRPKTLQFR